MRFDSSRAITCNSSFFDSSHDLIPHAPTAAVDLTLPTKVSHHNCTTSISSSSSSSIGNNSDLSSQRSMEDDDDPPENEAHSPYKPSFHMISMQSLEQVLPLSRGISKFYEGKSKSFTSLADCSSSPSMKDLTKPDNAYARKRRNVMAFNHIWNKNRSFSLKGNNGGISKRPLLSSSRSTLALAVAMNNNNSDSNSSITSEESLSNSSSSPPFIPPLHPPISVVGGTTGTSSPFARNFSAWRSFSLVDLQQCATTATMKMPSSSSLASETALSKLT